MGALDELNHKIALQFISFYDSVLFLEKYENSDRNNAIYLLKQAIKHSPIFIKKTEYDLDRLAVYDDYYSEISDDVQYYITKQDIFKNLHEPNEFNQSHGMGLKGFLSIVQGMGVNVPCELLATAQSPDCYHDNSNELTPVIKELQAENTQLQQELYALKNSETQSVIDRQADRIRELEKALMPKKPNAKASNNFGKVVLALLSMAELNTDEPYSYDRPNSTNSLIYAKTQELGLSIEPQTIGNIITIAKEQI